MTESPYDETGLCRDCRERQGSAHAFECRHYTGAIPSGSLSRLVLPDGSTKYGWGLHPNPVCAVVMRREGRWSVWTSHSSEEAAQKAITRIELDFEEVRIAPVEQVPNGSEAPDGPAGRLESR